MGDKYYFENEVFSKGIFETNVSKDIIELITKKYDSGKILDLACGDGATSVYLSKKGYDVTCIDISTSAIKHIISQNDNILAFEADLNFYEYYDTYDVIIIAGILHLLRVECAKNLIKNSMSSLLKNGILIIDAYLKNSFNEGYEPSISELKKLVSSSHIIELKEYSDGGKNLVWIVVEKVF